MEGRIRLALLGGDARQLPVARRLAEGYEVLVWGLDGLAGEASGVHVCADWRQAIKGADAILLPLPCSADGVRVFAPYSADAEGIRLDVLLGELKKDVLLLGGRLPEAMRRRAEERGVRWVDYLESEVLQLRNALPTAEGAIAIAMRELPVTLDGACVAVVGYGRIGSLLAQKLRALGAEVTVYARRAEQRALATLQGAKALPLTDGEGRSCLSALPRGLRVLFSTVPHPLLSESVLRDFPRECLLVDLASPPGGVDRAAAAALGIKTVWGSALPGRYAPESAGEILGQTLAELLCERIGRPSVPCGENGKGVE